MAGERSDGQFSADRLHLASAGNGLPVETAVRAYRIHWSYAFQNPMPRTVLVREAGGVARATMAKDYYCEAPAGIGRVVAEESASLERSGWDRIVSCFDASGFWTLPTEDPSVPLNDGGGIVVEGIGAGRYHKVARRTLDADTPVDPAALEMSHCVAMVAELWQDWR
jgi:hypothetical protein